MWSMPLSPNHCEITGWGFYLLCGKQPPPPPGCFKPECLQQCREARPWHLHTNHLWDFSPRPWLMLQQCSFGMECSPCRLPSDSLRNSFTQTRPPRILWDVALISLAGKETRGSERRKEDVKNKVLIVVVWRLSVWLCDARGGRGEGPSRRPPQVGRLLRASGREASTERAGVNRHPTAPNGCEDNTLWDQPPISSR